MGLFESIVKKKPKEAKCMQLFLTKIKEDKSAKVLHFSADEAAAYENFDSLLNTFKKQNYITWEKDDNGNYEVKLTPLFFKSFAPVLNML